jgi:hypothetical protein
MPDFDSLKASLTNITQIARGGQKIVFGATHPSYGAVVLKKKLDQLSKISPPKNMENGYSRMLFEGAMPSSTNYSERNSHLHYLNCLKIQSETATKSTYDETKDAYLALLNTASALTSGLKNLKIRGQNRDYGEIVDVIEAAISVFDNEFKYVISREWSTL